jgi:hypothetical protein
LEEPHKIVLYWTGRLPEISILAIVSALTKTKNSKILVFLDSDDGFQSSVPTQFDWLKSHPRLEFVNFSLRDWVVSAKPISQLLSLSRFRRVLVAVLNSVGFLKRIGQFIPNWAIRSIGFWHPTFGWKAKTSQLYAIGYEGPQFRGDVFRLLVQDKFPGQSVLYIDADVYISKPLKLWGLSSSFSYRGGDFWANTAILFYHSNRHQTSHFLLEEFRKGGSPLPWFMFTDTNCSKSGIEVHPADQYDPGWSVSSVSHGDAQLFFKRSASTAKFLTEVKDKFLAVHWHNQWEVTPENGSAFQILLDQETAELRAQMKQFGIHDLDKPNL